MSAAASIDRYGLEPHPEGGYYARTYCSEHSFPGNPTIDSFPAGRPWSTAILYLLQAGDFAAFHRIRSDELWHFHEGGPIEIFILQEPGRLKVIRLGPEHQLQLIVPADHWFAARPIEGTAYALVGCTVCPGFRFEDHEMANADALTAEFPAHAPLIRSLCRE